MTGDTMGEAREKLKVREVMVVEGRYDATALASCVDGLILTTDGFSIFSDAEKKDLLRRLGRQRGLVILTDSDAAGFRIRHYIEKIVKGCVIKHAYIPAMPGKEPRKAAPGKEGLLGVEGLSPALLLEALRKAGVTVDEAAAAPPRQPVTPTLLYELGLSGTAGSAGLRRRFLQALGLPPRLSKKALCEVLTALYTPQQLAEKLAALPNEEGDDG